MSQSLSELTPILFVMELTHLDSEISIYLKGNRNQYEFASFFKSINLSFNDQYFLFSVRTSQLQKMASQEYRPLLKSSQPTPDSPSHGTDFESSTTMSYQQEDVIHIHESAEHQAMSAAPPLADDDDDDGRGLIISGHHIETGNNQQTT